MAKRNIYSVRRRRTKPTDPFPMGHRHHPANLIKRANQHCRRFENHFLIWRGNATDYVLFRLFLFGYGGIIFLERHHPPKRIFGPYFPLGRFLTRARVCLVVGEFIFWRTFIFVCRLYFVYDVLPTNFQYSSRKKTEVMYVA